MATSSFLYDQHRLIEAMGTRWNLYFLKRCRFTLLAFQKCRHPKAVCDAWLWVLEVDRQTLFVPGSLGARVAHGLVDAVASGTLHNAYIEQLDSSVYKIEPYMILSYKL